MAGRLEEREGFVAEIRLGGGQKREGFEGHGAQGDAVLLETSADEREETLPLRSCCRVERGGNHYVSAGLPFLLGKPGGYLGEQIAIRREEARLTAADEARHLGGTAVLVGIAGTERADEIAGGAGTRASEERARGLGGIAGLPGARARGRLCGTRSGEDGLRVFAWDDFGAEHEPPNRGQYTSGGAARIVE